MGNPGYEFGNDDGSVTWEYTRQPSGVHCYMITLGPDRIVQKLEQVLNDANYAMAREGMDRDQIRRLLHIEPPEAIPREPWECKYCTYTACPSHPGQAGEPLADGD